MHVGMLSYTESGGAGRAAVRLLKGLNSLSGIECQLMVYCRDKVSQDIIELSTVNPFLEHIQKQYFQENIYPGHVLMSLMYSGITEQDLNQLLKYDILHFHWIAKYLSVEALRYLSNNGKKLVWTLHDLNPMTGGCHCAYGCHGYQHECAECHQLRDNPYDITRKILRIKEKYIPKDLVVVSPSKWLADCAKKSKVFSHHRIEIIPNSIELDSFFNMNKNQAKKLLHIHEDALTILYGAEVHSQIHKGFKYFLKAIQIAKMQDKFKALLAENKVCLILIGNVSIETYDDFVDLEIPFKCTGYINDDRQLASIYSAADITVLSSIEDNLPNIMLESLACGTPVVGFNTGGIPDIIKNGINGIVVENKDFTALGTAVVKALGDTMMRRNSRIFAEKYLSQELQAKRYLALYEDVLSPQTPSLGKYKISKESIEALAPYLYQTMEYVHNLDRSQLNAFLEGSFYERYVMEFAIEYIYRLGEAKIAIWGRGKFSLDLISELQRLSLKKNKKVNILGIFDNAAIDESAVFCGYPILDKHHMEHYGLQYIIIAAPKYENEIYEQIIRIQQCDFCAVRLAHEYQMHGDKI